MNAGVISAEELDKIEKGLEEAKEELKERKGQIEGLLEKLTEEFPYKYKTWQSGENVALFTKERKGHISLPVDLKNWVNKSKGQRKVIIEGRNISAFLKEYSEKIPNVMIQGSLMEGLFDSLHEDWEEYSEEILRPLWQECLRINREEALEKIGQPYSELFPETKDANVFRGPERAWSHPLGSKIEKELPKSPRKINEWFDDYMFPEDLTEEELRDSKLTESGRKRKMEKEILRAQKWILGAIALVFAMADLILSWRESKKSRG